MNATITRNRKVGAFTWISPAELANRRADDEATETFTEECAADCGHQVTERTPYWYCADTADLVHDWCPIPIWDQG